MIAKSFIISKSFKLRVRFHDYMWQRKTRLQRLCTRLPLYFSDPYYMSKRKLRKMGFEI